MLSRRYFGFIFRRPLRGSVNFSSCGHVPRLANCMSHGNLRGIITQQSGSMHTPSKSSPIPIYGMALCCAAMISLCCQGATASVFMPRTVRFTTHMARMRRYRSMGVRLLFSDGPFTASFLRTLWISTVVLCFPLVSPEGRIERRLRNPLKRRTCLYLHMLRCPELRTVSSKWLWGFIVVNPLT